MAKFASPYFAAIDLGSNSFHMLIMRKSDSGIETLDRVKEMVQIARGMKADGTLNGEAQQRALECLKRFSERLSDIPTSQVRAVGTKALRAAKNSKSFLKLAERALGFPIQIISGYEEARLIYQGLAHTTESDHQRRLVIDIGGGSTEFVIGQDHKTSQMESLNFGCVVYSEQYLTNVKVTEKSLRKAYLAASDELEVILKPFLKQGWEIVYGTSGTMRSIAELINKDGGGGLISRESLKQLIKSTIEEGGISNDNLPKLRRDVLPAGLAILKAIFDQLKIEAIHVADATLKEGLIYDTIGRFSNHDSREQTVANLQTQYQIDPHQAERVKKTALHFWSQIDSLELPGISRTKVLRWAALLHEIGLNISHSGHHYHGYYILRHSDLAGFGRYEQYVLSNLVRHQRRKLNSEYFENIDEQAQAAFIPLLICLRLAVLLNRRRETPEQLPKLRLQDSKVLLRFKSGWLDQHPLTYSSLEKEAEYLRNINIGLKFE